MSMTIELFLIILAVCSTVSSFVTEGVKKFLDSLSIKYASNIVVLIVSLVIGVGGMLFYYLELKVVIDGILVVYALLMGIAVWLSAMLGYDKVMQAISQLKKE